MIYKYFTLCLLLFLSQIVETQTQVETTLKQRWKLADVENGYNNWFDADTLIDESVYLDVFFLKEKPNLGWACGFNSNVIKTTDTGRTWKGVKVSQFKLHLETIQFINDSVGYVSGPGGGGNEFNLHLYAGAMFKTTDGGATWADIHPQAKDNTRAFISLWGFHFIDEDYGFLMGGDCNKPEPNNVIFFKTTNGGTNWTKHGESLDNSNTSDPLIIEKDGLTYAVSSGMIWKSENGGDDWTQYIDTPGSNWHEELAHKDGAFLLPVSGTCFGSQTADGAVYFYKNDTTLNSLGNLPPMYGTFLLSDTSGYAVGFDRTVLYTQDAGLHWENRNDCIERGDFDDIFFLNDSTGYLVGDGVYYLGEPEEVTRIYSSVDTVVCSNIELTLTPKITLNNSKWKDESGNVLSTSATYSGAFSENSTLYFETSNGICSSTFIETIFNINLHEREVKFILDPSNKLCKGDTVRITTSEAFDGFSWESGEETGSEYTVSEDKIVNLSVYDEKTGCYYHSAIEIKFNELPSPEILLEGKWNVCVGDTISLSSKSNHSNYKWVSLPDSSELGNEHDLLITKKGDYKISLQVENEFGCSAISNTIDAIVRADTNKISLNLNLKGNSANYKITKIGDMDCQNVQIENVSWEDFIIESPYLFDNLAFSIPDYQLPLLVPAGETIDLLICFAPNSNSISLDTIVITDRCSNHKAELKASGLAEQYKGHSLCDIDFLINDIANRKDYYSDFSNPYPNPATENIRIDFIYFIENGRDIDAQLSLYNLTGELTDEMSINILSQEKSEFGTYSSGFYEIKLDDYKSGIYILKIEMREFSKPYKITVVK